MVSQPTILLLSFVSLCLSQFLVIQGPTQFAETYRDGKIRVYSSSIGFKPKSGTLHGKIKLANPLSACGQVDSIKKLENEEDIFLLANDLECLQSVKAQNLAVSGAYIGLIKRNLNNTLHDKSVNIVHIPILQLQPNDYDRLATYMSNNPIQSILALADFNLETQKKINIELWLSPTQLKAYQYIYEFQKFITNQQQKISFHPRYVLHSQTSRKQYIGCFSSGRFCPAQLQFEGKPEGSKVVAESLRQIIIASKSISNWFGYIYYYIPCLRRQDGNLWVDKNAELCSENAMQSTGIRSQQIVQQFSNSFQGPRHEVDSNIYLEQERQLYIQQKITKFPILLINGKQYNFDDPDDLKFRICSMIHPDPSSQTAECQLLTNPPLFTSAQICIIIGISLVLFVGAMFLCKKIIYRRMKKQMKSQVDKTLSQYYRYMDTLQEPDPSAQGKVPLIQEKIETNQIGSVELSQVKNN